MASGHANRANRPNTWLHRPATRRHVLTCQPGAVRIHGQLCLGAMEGKSIDSQIFVKALCEDILACAGNFRRLTAIECVVVSHPLHVADAVPLGLIINELIVNALKYAFPNGTNGRIWVILERIGTKLRLTVNDNEVGPQHSVQGTGVPSENLIRWICRRKENRLMIETDGDPLQTFARISVGLLSFA